MEGIQKRLAFGASVIAQNDGKYQVGSNNVKVKMGKCYGRGLTEDIGAKGCK